MIPRSVTLHQVHHLSTLLHGYRVCSCRQCCSAFVSAVDSFLPLVDRSKDPQDRCAIYTCEDKVVVSGILKIWSKRLMWSWIRVFDGGNIPFRFPVRVVRSISVRQLIVSDLSCCPASTLGAKIPFLVVNNDRCSQVLWLDVFPRILWFESLV